MNSAVYQFPIFVPRLRLPFERPAMEPAHPAAESAGEPDQPVMRTGSVFRPRRTRLSL